ncbi:pentapeptide repeat-containing protein [Autumnicola musiva]|uniref:Pentapeptide repeat-containing protein n=1 Tax=Autumnicola musiva TaxID=3075589 RepID=A0ABU3D4X8_9FLAO|nr:pentapeptide repeat-containing protein [Zunongwangia sp. F117]MDT0676461.1 pentapeptide repeat-containing protein [Zunongwangia sp. F117]
MRSVITEEDFKANFQLAVLLTEAKVLIENKIFNFNVVIPGDTLPIHFKDCEFNETISFSPAIISKDVNRLEDIELYEKSEDNFFDIEEDVEIRNEIRFSDNCEFKKEINLEEVTFNAKFLIHDSKVELIKFNNTKFQSLADFWKTTFKNRVIFYKSDFNATAVFSMATFEENALFTYSLLGGKSIFSRTQFKKGVDLSQAIISGQLKFFDLKINYSDFKSRYFHKDNKGYQNAIDNQGDIPLVNKQETFRLLKHYSSINGDGISGSRFKVLEYRSFHKLIWIQSFCHGHRLVSNLANIPMMFLNRISNNYGSNFWLASIFTVGFAGLFLNGMLFNIGGFDYTWNYENWQWKRLAIILNPLHKVNELKLGDSQELYILDFISRIAVGYGIYQTVQAFRKYK